MSVPSRHYAYYTARRVTDIHTVVVCGRLISERGQSVWGGLSKTGAGGLVKSVRGIGLRQLRGWC